VTFIDQLTLLAGILSAGVIALFLAVLGLA
jgi:hypothetical protein